MRTAVLSVALIALLRCREITMRSRFCSVGPPPRVCIGPFFLLTGPFVRITNIEAPDAESFISTSRDFIFTRDQQGFESVMVYFHIDRNQRYIQSLGFNNVNNRQIQADPHGFPGMDNSHYMPNPMGAGSLAFGEGGVDDAEDADIILHEYGHAIQDNQTNGKYLTASEARAMGEGIWRLLGLQ